MGRQLFLTGEKQTGKTTVIRNFLRQLRTAEEDGQNFKETVRNIDENSWFPGCGIRIGGFRTVRTDVLHPGVFGVYLLTPGSRNPSLENQLFLCGGPQNPEAVREAFNRMGRSVMEQITGKEDLILMDELGPHEVEAVSFREMIRELICGDTPVLGVLQMADSPFLEEIAAMKETEVHLLTPENRKDMQCRLSDWFRARQREALCQEGRDSCGGIIFSRDGSYVLMVKSFKGWSFPKGHGFLGERPEETAIREIYEETGVSAGICNDFCREIPSARKNEKRKIVFFGGFAEKSSRPLIPLEVEDCAWVPVNEAGDRIWIESDRKVYESALEWCRKSRG